MATILRISSYLTRNTLTLNQQVNKLSFYSLLVGIHNVPKKPQEPRARNRLYLAEQLKAAKSLNAVEDLKFETEKVPKSYADYKAAQQLTSLQLEDDKPSAAEDAAPEEHHNEADDDENPMFLPHADVKRLRRLYRKSVKKTRYTVFMLYNEYDQDLSFMTNYVQNLGVLDLGKSKRRVIAYHQHPDLKGMNYPRLHPNDNNEYPAYANEKLVNLRLKLDAEEHFIWHYDLNSTDIEDYMNFDKSALFRRMLRVLRFQRISSSKHAKK